ncbi:MAG: 2,3,4,5-tetrahydropyridine-2,6-dicarboxylate N-acetyltransferase, partial [Eubacterium callanderi]
MTNEELKKQFDLNDPYQIAKYIKAVEKSTPVKAYVRGYLRPSDLAGYEYYGDPSACIIIGEAGEISALLDAKTGSISSVRIECDRRNSAI